MVPMVFVRVLPNRANLNYTGASPRFTKMPGRQSVIVLPPSRRSLPEHEEAERERDLILLSDKADLSNPKLTEALKRYFDRNSVLSKRVQYCGVALVGFEAAFYPGDGVRAVAAEIATAARSELDNWRVKIGERLKSERIDWLY